MDLGGVCGDIPSRKHQKSQGMLDNNRIISALEKKLQGTGKRQAKKAKSKEPKVKEGKRCLNKMGKSEKAK